MPKTSSMTTRRLALSVAALAIGCATMASDASATRSDLTSFLQRAAQMATHTHPVRADLTITKGDGTTTKATAIVDSESKRLFYANADGSWRALAPLGWEGTGKVSVAKGSTPAKFGPNDPLGGTDLRAISFFPFWANVDLNTAFISDNTRLEKTVTLYPPDTGPYMLLVLTFDKEKLVPVTTKFYAGQMNNLVRLQSDTDYTMVGARPRPNKIIVNNYEDNTKTTFAVKWTLLESIPQALLNESTFHTAAIDQ